MRSTAAGPDAAAVVQRQLDAYNTRDVDALLEVYALDAQLFEHPAKLLASGSAELRVRFTERFREPDLRAQLLSRVVMGNIVVDHECVTRNFPEGRGTLAMIMIYEVSGDRIQRAWSIAGAREIESAR